MKLSTKGRYGLRAMIDLGIHAQTEHVSIKSIATRLNMSENYLEQLIAKLKKANLVTSTRGAYGGYALSESPEAISLGVILRALEGDLNPVDCVTNNAHKECADADQCATKYVWKRISDSINQVVDHITLAELIEEQMQIEKQIQNEKGQPESPKEAHIG